MSEDNFDIYGDLDDALIEPLQEEVQKKVAEEQAKQKEVENFKEETQKVINELKTSNFQLKKNMSLLLATAKSEIERKDQQIKDLRREMDEIIFRKNKSTTKKSCEKWTQTSVEFHPSSDSSRLHDRTRDVSNSKKELPAHNKRDKTPERKYSDDYRRKESTNGSRNDKDRERKSSHEKTRSRSPEKFDRHKRYDSQKDSLRSDDLRRALLKGKTEDKSSHSGTKNSSSNSKRKDDDKRERRDDKKRDRSKDREVRNKSTHKEKARNEKSDRRDKEKCDKIESIKNDVKQVKIIGEKSVSPKKSNKKEAINSSNKNKNIDLKQPVNLNVEDPSSNLNLLAELDISEALCIKDNKKIINLTPVAEKIENIEEKCKEQAEIQDNSCGHDEKNLLNTEIIESKSIENVSLETPKISETQIKTTHETEQSKESVEKEETIPEHNETENKLNLSTESANDSLESTKENSLNNSSEIRKNKKRKIVTTEIESDGTVVWTITRKKRKKN